MTKHKQIVEDALISGKSIDELIKIKMKEEIKNIFERNVEKITSRRIENIKDVPRGRLFSKDAIFKIFNKHNNTVSFINGIQAEALLGLDEVSREKLLHGESDTFSTENSFVKFEYVETKYRI